jgi:hypothetical protein
MVVPSEVAVGRRFQQAALQRQLRRQGRLTRRVDGGERAIRALVPEIDGRKIDGDRRLARAVNAIVDLVLQELRGRLEKVEGDEALCQLADHLVAVGPDRNQPVCEFVEQSQRLDGIEAVGLPNQEKPAEIVSQLDAQLARAGA